MGFADDTIAYLLLAINSGLNVGLVDYYSISISGKHSFSWTGPVPQVNIFEPELIREILTKPDLYHKPNVTPVFALLLPGLINLEAEKWTIHRRLLDPAFHVEKLKLMMPAFYSSCLELITEWDNIVSKSGSLELDVEPRMATLSADAEPHSLR